MSSKPRPKVRLTLEADEILASMIQETGYSATYIVNQLILNAPMSGKETTNDELFKTKKQLHTITQDKQTHI